MRAQEHREIPNFKSQISDLDSTATLRTRHKRISAPSNDAGSSISLRLPLCSSLQLLILFEGIEKASVI